MIVGGHLVEGQDRRTRPEAFAESHRGQAGPRSRPDDGAPAQIGQAEGSDPVAAKGRADRAEQRRVGGNGHQGAIGHTPSCRDEVSGEGRHLADRDGGAAARIDAADGDQIGHRQGGLQLTERGSAAGQACRAAPGHGVVMGRQLGDIESDVRRPRRHADLVVVERALAVGRGRADDRGASQIRQGEVLGSVPSVVGPNDGKGRAIGADILDRAAGALAAWGEVSGEGAHKPHGEAFGAAQHAGVGP